MSITLEIPDAVWLSANQRLHWAEKARRTSWVRAMARAEAEAITALYAAQPTVREAKAEGWRRGYSDACKRYGHELGTYGDKIPASPFDHSEADHG